jgi:hypothetical protein
MSRQLTCNEGIKMRTVIKLMILMAFIPALIVYGCGGGSSTTDGISSGITESGNTSLIQDDGTRTSGSTDGISFGLTVSGIASLVQKDRTETKGDISGTVDERLLASMQCSAGSKAVYIFRGHDASPDDIDINEPNPVQLAKVVYNNVSRQYRYSVHSLSEGIYTLAFTCQAGNDSPEYDDDIRFGGMKNVTITEGKEVISNLFL